jgi:putative aldouronate transport system substrate-binding protein
MRIRKSTVIALVSLFVTFGAWAGGGRQSTSSAKVPVKPSGTFPIADQTVTLSVLLGHPPQVSDLINNSYTRFVEQKLGIKLEIIEANEKRDLLLNTGDYPEVFLVGAGNTDGITKYGMTEHVFIPLESYFDQYGKNILKMMDQYPGFREGLAAPDGHTYALGSPIAGIGDVVGNTGYKMWINTVWLDKLGLKMPTTTDELLTVLRAFKTMDPNGNGRADEIPLTGAIGTWAADPYLFLLNCFTYYYEWSQGPLKLSKGTITGTANTTGFREGLRFVRQLFSEGLLDPAAFTQNEAQLSQLGSSNPTVIGAFTAGHVAMGINIQNAAIYAQYDVVPPLRGSNGYLGTPVTSAIYPYNANIAITDKCKNPEAAMRLIDLFYDVETMLNGRWGPRGTVWDFATPGSKDALGNPAVWKDLPGMDQSGINTARNDYWHQAVQMTLGTDMEGERKEFGGDYMDPLSYWTRILYMSTQQYLPLKSDGEQFQTMWIDTDTSTELTNTITPINTYVKGAISEFITGTRNIETGWNAYLAELERLGYSAYIKKYSDTYFANTAK